MTARIADDKFVELTYRILDQQTGSLLTQVDFPLGYVHGRNPVLDPRVMAALQGKAAGDRLAVPIDCTELYGARDESLVVTDRIENVPAEYHAVGTRILMQNERGETKDFLVTRLDEQTLTIDGNHPLCGRQVIFELEVVNVRDATEQEIRAGGAIVPGPDLGGAATRSI